MAEPKGASELFWSLEKPDLSWIKELHLHTVDSLLREGTVITYNMGKIFRPGVSSLPPGFDSFISELQEKYRRAERTIHLTLELRTLSMLYSDPEDRLGNLVKKYIYYRTMAKEKRDVKMVKYIEDNRGSLKFLDTSSHSGAISYPEIVSGMFGAIGNALGERIPGLLVHLQILSLKTIGDIGWNEMFVNSECDNFWKRVTERGNDISKLPDPG